MTFTFGKLIVEVNPAYAFVKLGRWEMFCSFEKGRGPAGRRIMFSLEGGSKI